MKTLKEALSNTEKEGLIAKLNKAIYTLENDPNSIDDISWHAIDKKLDIFDDEKSADAQARNRIKNILWNKGVTNLKDIYDTIEKYSTYSKFEKLLNIISSDELVDYIGKYSLTEILKGHLDKDYDKKFIYELYKIAPSTTQRSTGSGEVLLKCILSDCIISNKSVSDVYCVNNTFEVKNLLNTSKGSETKLFGDINWGYEDYGLDNTINKNIKRGIMDPIEKPFYEEVYKRAFIPYYNKHNKGNFTGILLIMHEDMDMAIMDLNNIKNEYDLFDFLHENRLILTRKNRLTFKVEEI